MESRGKMEVSWKISYIKNKSLAHHSLIVMIGKSNTLIIIKVKPSSKPFSLCYDQAEQQCRANVQLNMSNFAMSRAINHTALTILNHKNLNFYIDITAYPFLMCYVVHKFLIRSKPESDPME